jgi:hypothetical protein
MQGYTVSPFLRRPLPCFTYLHVPSVIRSHTVTIIIIWNVKARRRGRGLGFAAQREAPGVCPRGFLIGVLYSTESRAFTPSCLRQKALSQRFEVILSRCLPCQSGSQRPARFAPASACLLPGPSLSSRYARGGCVCRPSNRSPRSGASIPAC